MLQKVPDALRLAQLARARRTWEIRKRLGFPDAKRQLKNIALAEQRVLAGSPSHSNVARVIAKHRLLQRIGSSVSPAHAGAGLGAGGHKKRAPNEVDAPCFCSSI